MNFSPPLHGKVFFRPTFVIRPTTAQSSSRTVGATLGFYVLRHPLTPCRKIRLGRPPQAACLKLPKMRHRRDERLVFRHGPEPRDYLFDLCTPGYVVEFTWRTGGAR